MCYTNPIQGAHAAGCMFSSDEENNDPLSAVKKEKGCILMKKNATKKALLGSILAIMLCLTMLVGTTFAWFTDTASANVNKIQSGTLDVRLEMKTGSGWTDAENQTLNFVTADDRTTNILWEPGCTYELPALRVVNNGNLNLKYKVVISGIDGDAELNKVIDWTLNGAPIASVETVLAPKAASGEFVIKGHMQETAGNDYMDKTIDGVAITVYATQANVENDSYGPDYDKDANGTPDHPEFGDVKADITVDANKEGDTVLESNDNTVKATVPAEALDTDTDKLTLKVEPTTVPAGITIADSQGTKAYEVTVSGLKEENSVPVAVELFVGKGLSNVKMYHNNSAMTDSTTKEAETYSYNAASGIVTMYVTSFSPFTVVYDAPAAMIGNVSYTSLTDALNAATENDTVILMKDISLGKTCVCDKWADCATDIFNTTLDGKGHTITMDEGVFFAGSMTNASKLENINFIVKDAAVAVNAYNTTFDNVTVGGSFEVANNCGAFVIYGCPTKGQNLTFKNCTMAARMYGGGTATNYNAAFVGYGLSTAGGFVFDNCKITGSLACGSAALFLGNDAYLNGAWHVDVTNFTYSNDAVVHSTLTDGTRPFNGIVATNGAKGTPTVTIDGTVYSGKEGFKKLIDDKNTYWPNLFKYGPEDASLKLTKNEDGTFTITPAAAGATKYVVTLSVYTNLKTEGTLVQRVSETIKATEGVDSYRTELKDLKFVDDVWCNANTEASEGTLAGNIIYTLGGVSYYLISDTTMATLNGTPKAAQVYGVSAYDANGRLVASASLSK